MAKLTLEDFAATSVELELKHPKTNEPLGVSLSLVGPESDEYAALQRAWLKRPEVMSAKNLSELDGDAVAAYVDNLLTACVVGWSDDEFFGGPFSKEKARKLLTDVRFRWVRVQVSLFTDERTNFFR